MKYVNLLFSSTEIFTKKLKVLQGNVETLFR